MAAGGELELGVGASMLRPLLAVLLDSGSPGVALSAAARWAADAANADAAVVAPANGEPAVSTSLASQRFDCVQRAADPGPAALAIASSSTVVIEDLTDDLRSRDLAVAAISAGLFSEVVVPLRRHGELFGLLTVLRASGGPWSREDLASIEDVADVGAGLLAALGEHRSLRERVGQLEHALSARVVVEQAKGMIAMQMNIDPAQAFELLRQHARRANRSVHAVAQAVVDVRLVPFSRTAEYT